jgi:hypothetical protein
VTKDPVTQVPVVELAGSSMLPLVQAIPELESRTGRKAVIIGGLAVLCRLGTAYRVTGDLDTANRRAAGEPPQLDVLLESGGSPAGPAGVWIHTPSGKVQVDIIEITDAEVSRLPEDQTDRLAVLSHAWAIETATPLTIRAVGSPPESGPEVLARIAEPGPLIAMKLQSIMNRSADKERTDLLDIIRLTLDRGAGPSALAQLRNAAPQLASDARLHARRWFSDLKDQSLRRVRELPEGFDIDADTIELVGELLLAELDRPGH